jgi:hypothetical protein
LATYTAIEDDVRGADRHEMADQLYNTFTGLPSDRFPLIATHAAHLVAGDGDERFRFAIDVVIDGMLARATPLLERDAQARGTGKPSRIATRRE